MKKILLFSFMMALSLLAACSSDDKEVSSDNTQNGTKQEKNEENESISVDKGLFDVEVTLPSTFFEGEDIETIAKQAKEDGVGEVTQNEDGSITYKMTKSKHKEMMKEMEASVLESVDQITASEDFPSIKDVSYK